MWSAVTARYTVGVHDKISGRIGTVARSEVVCRIQREFLFLQILCWQYTIKLAECEVFRT